MVDRSFAGSCESSKFSLLRTEKPTLLNLLNLVDEPLATLPESKVRPAKEVLDQVMDELR